MDAPDRRVAVALNSAGPSTHGENCGCTRCMSFQPGNTIGETHGAYSVVRLAPRAAELRKELAAHVPLVTDGDAAAIDLASMCLTQLERAHIFLSHQQAVVRRAEEAGEDTGEGIVVVERLMKDMHRWTNVSLRCLDALGLTPTARGRLGADMVQVEKALTAASFRERYG